MYQKQNYSLEVISRLSDFNGKSLRKYKLEGIDTVGAWGDEPFEIKFTNHTHQKIQVKLSLDGTDILTGEQATSEPTGQMWVVNGYDSLVLKAWPESKAGGAGFVFTSANKSVAAHTHGDLSHRGIIAAAVFTEGHVEPARINHTYNYWHNKPYYLNGSMSFNSMGSMKGSSGVLRGRGMSTGDFCADVPTTSTTLSDSMDITDSVTLCSANGESTTSNSLQSLASVGAGSYVEQEIVQATGLIKPLLSNTVRVKYVWWDDLVTALRTNPEREPQPSGFPGDKPLMSIGSTPRLDTKEARDAYRARVIQDEAQFLRF